jgi:hypothetical protein
MARVTEVFTSLELMTLPLVLIGKVMARITEVKSYRSFYFVGVDDVRHFCIHDIDAWHEALGLHNMRLLAS